MKKYRDLVFEFACDNSDTFDGFLRRTKGLTLEYEAFKKMMDFINVLKDNPDVLDLAEIEDFESFFDDFKHLEL